LLINGIGGGVGVIAAQLARTPRSPCSVWAARPSATSRWTRSGPPDRRRADAVAELEQLALDPHVSPARVLPRHPHHQGDQDVLDRWPSGPVRVGPSSAHEAAIPTQDRVRSNRAMPTQRSGQPPYKHGEQGSVRPVHTRPWVGAAQHGDLMAQHKELDVLGGGRAAHQQYQSKHLPEDRIQQPQRHVGIMPNQRSSLVSDPGPTSGTPQGDSCFAVFVDQVPAAAQAARTARVSCGVACSGHGPRNLAAMMTRRSLTAMSS
jgi:hypothetical protein